MFIAVCALAGALAVPLSPVMTPCSALIAGAAGDLGLRAWRWSHLMSATSERRPGLQTRQLGLARLAGMFAIGLAVGFVALAVIRLLIEPTIPAAGARIAAAGTLPVWRRLAIIYVAAVSEELIFRLLLLSLIAGVLTRVLQRSGDAPGPGIVWTANILCALAFGLVHIPSWTAIGPMSAGLVAMVMALNGFGGLVFGHVFATRGIVAAMFAHAGADCVVQLIGPLT